MSKQALMIQEHLKQPGLKPFWLSFWMKPALYPEFECEFPWWISGQRGDECSIVAYILAKDEEDAWKFIDNCFDNKSDYEQRFCEQRKSEYSDRFVKPDWAIDPNNYKL